MKSIPTILVMLCLALPAAVQAQYTYTTNTDNTLTIIAYTGSGGAVTIPTNINGLAVTCIGSEAFQYNTNMISVTIPGSVTSVGEYAFDGLANLTSVTIPGSLTNIGKETFYECFNLTNVTMSNGITSIPLGMFDSCEYLINFTLPGSVTNIGSAAFIDCVRLTSLFFGGAAPTTAENAFSSTVLNLYYLPGTAGWVGYWADTAHPPVLWNPQFEAPSLNLDITNNQFGFQITGTSNIPIVLQACTNLTTPLWTTLTNVNLTNGFFNFSEPLQTNCTGRYYRITAP